MTKIKVINGFRAIGENSIILLCQLLTGSITNNKRIIVDDKRIKIHKIEKSLQSDNTYYLYILNEDIKEIKAFQLYNNDYELK